MKKSLTIGIAAFNEQETIIPLLREILSQEQKLFKLEKIIVASDGGHDQTAQLVRNFSKKNKQVFLIDGKTNQGKSFRLNQLLKTNRSAIFVGLDADISLSTKNVIDELIKPIVDHQADLTAGCDRPTKTNNTFVENIAAAGEEIWFNIRSKINNGDSVHNLHGCIFAITDKLCQKTVLPENLVADDEYLYINCKKQGFHFAFAKRAVINYQLPKTLQDYINQTKRFIGSEQQIELIFGKDVASYYTTPLTSRASALFYSFLKNPFYSVTWLIMFALISLLASNPLNRSYSGVWTPITSTKNGTS